MYHKRLPYLIFSCDELSVEGALHEGREERLAQHRLPQLHQLKSGSNHEDRVIICNRMDHNSPHFVKDQISITHFTLIPLFLPL